MTRRRRLLTGARSASLSASAALAAAQAAARQILPGWFARSPGGRFPRP